MTMTPEEFVSAQRMLKVLDDQLALMRRRADLLSRDWTLSPTDRQAFFYASDAQGVMRFHSNSSFVAEQIFVYNAMPSSVPSYQLSFLSIEDVSSGRGLTVAQEPNFADTTDVTTKLNGIWIPPSAWAPTRTSGYDLGDVTWNFDHVATLETDFVVARGGALRFRFRHSADGRFWPSDNPTGVAPLYYTVVLVGYKVY